MLVIVCDFRVGWVTYFVVLIKGFILGVVGFVFGGCACLWVFLAVFELFLLLLFILVWWLALLLYCVLWLDCLFAWFLGYGWLVMGLA